MRFVLVHAFTGQYVKYIDGAGFDYTSDFSEADFWEDLNEAFNFVDSIGMKDYLQVNRVILQPVGGES